MLKLSDLTGSSHGCKEAKPWNLWVIPCDQLNNKITEMMDER